MFYNYPQYGGYNYGQPMQDNLSQLRYQQQTTPNTDERIWVQGRSSADAYLVAPNGFVRLWDNNENIFYEKRADHTGRLYMDVYKYEKLDNTNAVKEESTDRLTAFENRLSAIERRLDNEYRSNDTTVQRVSEDIQRESAGRSSKTNKQRTNQSTTA